MERFILILMITGISASLSTHRIGGKSLSMRMCNKEGLMCKDCKTLVYCQKQDFQFVEYKVSDCSNDVPCDETKKACTIGGACRYKEFVCPYNLPKDQFLPDPYTCNQYWWCGLGEWNECTFPSSYNPNTTQCDLLMQENPYCLQDPLPPCQYNGQKLNMIGTPFHYECMEALPPSSNVVKYPTIYPYLMSVSPDTTTYPETTTLRYTTPKN